MDLWPSCGQRMLPNPAKRCFKSHHNRRGLAARTIREPLRSETVKMIRNLSRRLKRIEDRVNRIGEPLVIEVKFVSATGLVVDRRLFTCAGNPRVGSGTRRRDRKDGR
jgi:hypothetical protein